MRAISYICRCRAVGRERNRGRDRDRDRHVDMDTGNHGPDVVTTRRASPWGIPMGWCTCNRAWTCCVLGRRSGQRSAMVECVGLVGRVVRLAQVVLRELATNKN